MLPAMKMVFELCWIYEYISQMVPQSGGRERNVNNITQNPEYSSGEASMLAKPLYFLLFSFYSFNASGITLKPDLISLTQALTFS